MIPEQESDFPDAGVPESSSAPAEPTEGRRPRRMRTRTPFSRSRRQGRDDPVREGEGQVSSAPGVGADLSPDSAEGAVSDVPVQVRGRFLGADLDGKRGGRRPEPRTVVGEDSVKLHKVLADAGIGSRREMEELIAAGRVAVNGQAAFVGQRIGVQDRVSVNGRMLPRRSAPQLPRVMLYHKPSGEICTRDDPEQRPRVYDKLPRLKGARWVAIGRLDLNSEGLLIFSTSGELANRMAHPRYGWEREYAVRVLGRLDEESQARLLAGVELEDGLAAFQSIEDVGGDGANHWYRVVLSEGRNREVRRMFDAVGLTVSRLARVRFGPIGLPPRLARGYLAELPESDVRELIKLVRRTPLKGRQGVADGQDTLDAPADEVVAPAPRRERGARRGAVLEGGADGDTRRGSDRSRGPVEVPHTPWPWPTAASIEQAQQSAALARQPAVDDAIEAGERERSLPEAPRNERGRGRGGRVRGERPAGRSPAEGLSTGYTPESGNAQEQEPEYEPFLPGIADDNAWNRSGVALAPDLREGSSAALLNERSAPVGRSAGRRPSRDDDDWQPNSDTAHLEGITRAFRRDQRQQRWGAPPKFASKAGPAMGAGAAGDAPRRAPRSNPKGGMGNSGPMLGRGRSGNAAGAGPAGPRSAVAKGFPGKRRGPGPTPGVGGQGFARSRKPRRQSSD